ncbi:hypothetical protein GCM10011613_32430 [Cellvibrio zantedeschiae]|uniref:Flagellar motor switch protein FliN-like C-terminal domain-containing protein n=1 Tax=Cellvibrio zantedeschiae TaxID=1237077 RepID=A0ABQ3B9K0_9GAMM|nr:FliM/FliN family flagellar motor switch protein [Cellvibrio zantedeschiae]GGY84882.1 hypothetical protein GCM10011613_32430 [Cellvibrio zantedeschiae]
MIFWINYTTAHDLNNMLPLALLNQDALSDLELYLTNNVKNWMSDWCFSQIIPRVSITSCEKIDFDACTGINICKKNSRFFFTVEDKNMNWRKIIFSNANTLDGSAIKKLTQAATTDLFAELFGSHEISNLSSLSFPKHIKTYMRVTVSFEEAGSLNFFCPHWMWSHQAKKVQLKALNKKIKRDHFIASSIASLSVSLQGGNVSVEDLKNAGVGTIIKLQSPVENKFSISIGSKKIASVALGKLDIHKAFITLKE